MIMSRADMVLTLWRVADMHGGLASHRFSIFTFRVISFSSANQLTIYISFFSIYFKTKYVQNNQLTFKMNGDD